MAKKATVSVPTLAEVKEGAELLQLGIEELLSKAHEHAKGHKEAVAAQANELHSWQSLQDELSGYRELAEQCQHLGLYDQLGADPAALLQLAGVGINAATRKLSELEAARDVDPLNQLWVFQMEQRAARERAAKAAHAEAVKTAKAGLEADNTGMLKAMHEDGRYAGIQLHARDVLLPDAKKSAARVFGLPKGQHATVNQTRKVLSDLIVAYLGNQGFVGAVKVGETNVVSEKFAKIAADVLEFADPKRTKPVSGNVSSQSRRNRGNPKGQRRDDAAAEKPVVGMDDIDAHFLHLEAEGAPTAMESAFSEALGKAES